ncbi:dipeptidase 1 isoform X1 [Microplitis demolitor]|uniref:dipeptidase 1 isoform X1 n=3 Tax=Microplitis demolitor TaxID=69319 RepID=UPI0004CDCEE7|nr:dipeptidase 1 isoform X1 [Microplitis demolitor]
MKKMVYISVGIFGLGFFILVIGISVGLSATPFKGSDVLNFAPLIDGHNDLPWNIYSNLANNLSALNFDTDLRNDPLMGIKSCNSCYTDLPRLSAGKVGGQFWVAYTSCESQYKDAVQLTLRQIDVIKRLINKYPSKLEFVTDSGDIERVWKNGKIASMIGIEGGHAIDSSLAVLRLYHELGVRYITLTHTCNTPWADASTVNNASVYNLTLFGQEVIKEMNRLGIMIDLSHVSHNVMRNVLAVTQAPIIFSHSSAFEICNHFRNVPDDVLHLVKKNNGVVMVNFYNLFVNCNRSKETTVDDVIAHINHIRNLIGVDHVGIGSDFDGVDETPKGLEDVSKYPELFDRLYEPKENAPTWTRLDLEKLAGRNLIRVFEDVEKIRDSLKSQLPSDMMIDIHDLEVAQKNERLTPGACQTANEWKKIL